MLNSTTAWNMSYDDSTRNRAISTSISLWPKFVEFVKQTHLATTSREEWDPLTIDLSMLTTST